MAMSSRSGEALRANSRSLGLIFQTLSVLTIVATLYGTFKVSAIGSQLGIGAVHDPISWFIFLGGMFAGLMLAGIGHVLGMLCVIFDRQEIPPKQPGVRPPKLTPSPGDWRQQSGARPTVWEMVVEKETDKVVVNTAIVKPVVQSPTNASPTSTDGLWGWLTRERHFTSRDDDKKPGGR
jgi:hypothetical protein